MVVASVNAGKRLGAPRAASLFQAWLDRHLVTLVLVQEGWGGAMDTQVNLPGMTFVAGDAELAIWIRPGHVPPRTDRPARWWQVTRLGDVAIHSVHLDPYASATRVQQLRTLAADLAADARNIVLGDFNLAPRPSDGRFGDTLSSFTSASERSAFAKLMDQHDLVDATASDEPVFTISRLVGGVRSSFRCDLALIPVSLSPSIVRVSSETRTGPTGFTDHSGLVVDLDENLPPTAEPVPAPAEPRFDLSADESSLLTGASFKTAMRRRGPSAPAAATLPLIIRWIALAPVDEQFGDLLDYGCGTGADVTHYRSLGLDADGYDPHPPFGYADLPPRQFRVVTLIFVLNVLPTAPERLEVLRRAAAFLAPAGRLVVAARSASAIRDAARRGRWRAWNGGFVSHEGRSTFQHGMDDQEIHELGAGVGLRPAEAPPLVAGASLVAFINDADKSTVASRRDPAGSPVRRHG